MMIKLTFSPPSQAVNLSNISDEVIIEAILSSLKDTQTKGGEKNAKIDPAVQGLAKRTKNSARNRR